MPGNSLPTLHPGDRMKAVVIGLMIISQALFSNAKAAEIMRFFAQVESDALAEESILLVHCLSARSGSPWEFSGQADGRHWVKVEERKGTLEGIYQRDAIQKTFRLSTGETEKVCDQLEPAATPPISESLPPNISLDFREEENPGKKATWLWVGLGAALVGGFILWKSKQPSHRGVEMR